MRNERKFDFENLFIFELANNHQGSLEHGLRIIREMGEIAREFKIRAAAKLQFRDLDAIIHPEHEKFSNSHYMKRFLETRLSEEEFSRLTSEIKNEGLLTVATPFDEPSVDKIERLGVGVIKIGSPSNQDWPLLERASQTGKPVIVSVGGLVIRDIDKIVSFFQKRGVHFALLHCVSIYPTPNDKFSLNQIEILKNRYPGIVIGFSTHEEPSNLNAIRLAYAKGARIFEKHVGLETDQIKLNAYSANPGQVRAWLGAWREAVEACGERGEREIPEKEAEDLRTFVRGVWTKREIKAGETLNYEDVFFAMPLQEGQLVSGRFLAGLAADRDYHPNEALSASLRPDTKSKKEIVYHSIHAIKGMLNEAKVPVGHDFSVELSHHYGIERFQEVGAAIIECFNREYAKKILVQLSGQFNPEHYHKLKDETFQVLSGVLEVEVQGRKKILYPGDMLWIPRGVVHSFGTDAGAVFEEISTANHKEDSFYLDPSIAKLPRDERKTYLLNWGQHQLEDIEEQDLTGGV
ncbi:hypothetical protein A2757_01355 [Candidatus Giovannonibacteria bacterium RIFCSPHIGHO2_01_FULL_48_47]|nr:MAG: hypothetical protein A2757_01355 [Candidatus Giovannonibacteria bacterium RIFCSPHIGHO2_01_FULL_48_47]OGF68453.1 MAG: hypothetical protein A3D61_00640 [Candidatus Giovannonibacteria bacterium RIFCSPHIGHO2_02_FULL_48_15]OGF89702.1 MAG: hypothetical protein A3B26_01480 [Candidatus Giovannonibacteria bacterium RIFCSPLOWO2_01_FULL_48_47]OGF95486.1 MAG: hypothetical protein A2433_00060 [Candidatus Giovannonibacteria bacterium RIFOXYC1_FULL_48_8]OGF96228.1 MAG: hypothetical protein A2613_01210